MFLRGFRKMSHLSHLSPAAPALRTYENAVDALNNLQSNATQLAEQRASGGRNLEASLQATHVAVTRVGLSPADLAALRAIHIAGSKGKGSTSAMTESILRHHGLKTGLYTSPHLIEVRERIRINEKSVSQALFSKYFWECWDLLQASEGPMPPYFRFLTVMALKLFVGEGVDVAILEVGIGGRFDSTNVVLPRLCGITSLGLEHTELLGPTLADIAFHKAGILKPHVPAFVVPQPAEAMAVVQRIATEVQAPLFVTPPLTAYDSPQPIRLSLSGEHQADNASLAVQLAHAWRLGAPELAPSSLPLPAATSQDADAPVTVKLETAPAILLEPPTLQGLAECNWPGRSQTLVRNGVTYLIDGAHTIDSCQACARWAGAEFAASAAKPREGLHVVRVLWFNLGGPRDPHLLLQPFATLARSFPFSHALFCPNITGGKDAVNGMVAPAAQLEQSRACLAAWSAFNVAPPSENFFASSITEAFEHLQAQIVARHPGASVQVLVTGSLHLVGGVLKALEFQPGDEE